MEEATGSGGRGFRRECAFSDFEGRVLVIRWIDLRPGEVAEAWDFALWNLGRWLADASKASALAGMSLSASQAGGAAIGSMEQLRAKLEDAFRTRSLVVVRPGGKVRGDSGGPSEAHRTLREAGISTDLLNQGPRQFRRGWEMSGRSGTALVAKKSDLLPGEPTEEPQVAVFHMERWLADPKEKAALVEMYKSIHGFGDSAWGAPSILKTKIIAAFESRELVMLRQTHGATGGGGSGSRKSPSDRARAEEQQRAEQARRAERDQAGGKSTAPPAQKKQEKTWVRFRLLDEDGEPMDEESYEMVDSNGSQRKGKLDKDGCVYVPSILDPGNCTITFPEIHLNPLKNPNRKRTRKSA
jgi:hypothetical protein